MGSSPREIVQTCSMHYNYWKERALNEPDPVERKKALEKAFFWLETQTSLIVLWTIENSQFNNGEVKEKVTKARINLSKKLIEYAESVLREL